MLLPQRASTVASLQLIEVFPCRVSSKLVETEYSFAASQSENPAAFSGHSSTKKKRGIVRERQLWQRIKECSVAMSLSSFDTRSRIKDAKQNNFVWIDVDYLSLMREGQGGVQASLLDLVLRRFLDLIESVR
jgi:hypothetical protein